MKKIIVASLNPVKIEAAHLAFAQAFPNEQLDIQAVSVSSGVSNQPLSNEETYLGACNRVQAAQVVIKEADFYIAFEGGAEDQAGVLEEFAWVVVAHGVRVSHSRSASFSAPQALRDLVINQGLEIGDAIDQLFNGDNIKQKEGAVGCLSKGLITRRDLYLQPAILALIPFISPELY